MGAKIVHAQFLSFCGMDPPKSAHKRSRIAKNREKSRKIAKNREKSAEKCKNMPKINKKGKKSIDFIKKREKRQENQKAALLAWNRAENTGSFPSKIKRLTFKEKALNLIKNTLRFPLLRPGGCG
ncbi:MAG TPA: hypothetical protein PK722_04800 [Kiritimatiellia bacterium]|nr:hypothetical protein [Kiritimatiellia bacterium]HPA77944.1 hypothetical protein [Kiritimatiellia bacterium]